MTHTQTHVYTSHQYYYSSSLHFFHSLWQAGWHRPFASDTSTPLRGQNASITYFFQSDDSRNSINRTRSVKENTQNNKANVTVILRMIHCIILSCIATNLKVVVDMAVHIMECSSCALMVQMYSNEPVKKEHTELPILKESH